ncbi:KH domain-containing protein [Euzebya tangerina]|uniref:KH domain-containing protein n=1 Tax=Euzebya tangerina TaxID=591198 RepID=UPI000E31CE2B|nr:KH domain-containing protein [Euzebya tangerina]
MEMTEEVLDFIAKNLVDNPDDVHITSTDSDGGVLLELRVNPEDMGKVIGKRGRTAKAIRTMIKAAGTREGINASVEIIE